MLHQYWSLLHACQSLTLPANVHTPAYGHQQTARVIPSCMNWCIWSPIPLLPFSSPRRLQAHMTLKVAHQTELASASDWACNGNLVQVTYSGSGPLEANDVWSALKLQFEGQCLDASLTSYGRDEANVGVCSS